MAARRAAAALMCPLPTSEPAVRSTTVPGRKKLVRKKDSPKRKSATAQAP
jgi:hypothetical protein